MAQQQQKKQQKQMTGWKTVGKSENFEEIKKQKKNDRDAINAIFTLVMMTLQTGGKKVVEDQGLWFVLKLADKMINKLIRGHATYFNKKTKNVEKTNVARVSVFQYLVNHGYPLEQEIKLSSRTTTLRELLLKEEFEDMLFKALKKQFVKFGKSGSLNNKWTSVQVRRFNGEKPDVTIELWFNPEFERTKIVDMLFDLEDEEESSDEEEEDQKQEKASFSMSAASSGSFATVSGKSTDSWSQNNSKSWNDMNDDDSDE